MTDARTMITEARDLRPGDRIIRTHPDAGDDQRLPYYPDGAEVTAVYPDPGGGRDIMVDYMPHGDTVLHGINFHPRARVEIEER